MKRRPNIPAMPKVFPADIFGAAALDDDADGDAEVVLGGFGEEPPVGTVVLALGAGGPPVAAGTSTTVELEVAGLVTRVEAGLVVTGGVPGAVTPSMEDTEEGDERATDILRRKKEIVKLLECCLENGRCLKR
jgi:hypothetical protein